MTKRNRNIAIIVGAVWAVVILFFVIPPVYNMYHPTGLEYKDNGDGTCTITGCDYDTKVGIKHLNIPRKVNGLIVTAIGDAAFENYSNIGKITMPDSVLTIGNSAFSGCWSSVITKLPNNVTTIGNQAFFMCYGFTITAIPDSVTSIGEMAFLDCKILGELEISKNVTKIGDRAFQGYTLTSINVSEQNPNYSSLDGILFNKDKSVLVQAPIRPKIFDGGNYNIPDSVNTIATGAFETCYNLRSVIIPNSVTTIGSRAFYGLSDLKSVVIPDSVTAIGSWAFNGCSSLKSMVIPNSMTKIGEGAFSFCRSFTGDLVIPENVTYIGQGAFSGCSNLTSIEVSEKNPTYSSVDGVLFSKDMSVLLQVFKGEMTSGSYTIPNGVITIGDDAFFSCDGLKNVTIPNSVTNIGDSAFFGSNNLESLQIPESVTTIGNSAFQSCENLRQVDFLGDAPANIGTKIFGVNAKDFRISYNPAKSGWSTPIWNGYPCYPKA